MLRLWKRERAAAYAIIIVVKSAAIAHALTHVSLRHRVPFVDVAALCLAPAVMWDWANACLARWRGARGTRAASSREGS